MEATATVSSTAKPGSSTVADLIRALPPSMRSTRLCASSAAAPGTTSATPSSATIVQEVGLGLIDLGIEPGERVCILANTRPEWTHADLERPPRGRSSCRSIRRTPPRSASGCRRLRAPRDRL